jgi:hypothetical protein
MEHKFNEFPLTALFRELRDEVTTLIRQEVALAKAEFSENMKRVVRDVTFIVAGIALAFTALIFLLMTFRNILVLALVKGGADPEVASWLSPLIVALVVGGVAWALVAKGKKALAHDDLKPRKSVESLREDKMMIKQKLAHS